MNPSNQIQFALTNPASAVSAVVVVTPRSHGGNPFKSKEALPC